ncbi:MAG: biotin--[acetyl-CoA-carboxylase] ligase [Elusimicrobiales bacterium]
MIFSISAKELDSTQNLAKELIEKGFGERFKSFVITAENQTNGRGQRDNKWSSEKGGLYFSYVYYIDEAEIHKIKNLSIEIAQTIKEALEETYGKYGIKLFIKPPNDIYAKTSNGDRKICGILIETTPRKGKRFIIIGAGVNFTNKIPKELREKASSLYLLTGKRFNKKIFLKKLLNRLILKTR